MKNYLIGLLAFLAVAGGVYLIYKGMTVKPVQLKPLSGSNSATTTGTQVATNKQQEQIGTSTQGRAIMAYHFGEGGTELLFVGGIHGGYSWDTALVAYELMDYLA